MKHLAAILVFLGMAASAQAFQVSLQRYNASCSGNDGAIIATASGGVPPYTYDWGNGPADPEIFDLAPGTYSVTVTDDAGNTATASCDVGPGAQPPGNITVFDHLGLGGLEPCPGVCNGGFRLHLFRMAGGYSFSTSPDLSYTIAPEDEPQGFDYYITYEFLGACAGQDVTLTITNGCGSAVSTIVVTEVAVPVVNVLQISGSCNGADDGTLSGEVTLDPMSLSLSSWLMRADDGMGTIVDHGLGSFYFGTEAFQLLGMHSGNWTMRFVTTESDGSMQSACTLDVPFVVPDLGTNCGILSGTVHYETDMDCIQNGSDPGMADQMLRITPGPLYAITGPDGSYTVAVPYGTYDLEQLNTVAEQLCPPAAPIPFTVSIGVNAVVDIADSLTTPFDMRVHVWPGVSRVGVPFLYNVSVRNQSGHPGEDVTVTLDYDPLFTYNNASLGVISNVPGQIQWTIPSLGAFEQRNLNIEVQVPPNPALLGTVHMVNVAAASTTNEPGQTDNADLRAHTIVSSYDPNDKQALTSSGQNEAVYLMGTDEFIDYLIRFQNTGTDTAFTITVADTISPLLDLASLEMRGSSHPYAASIATGNVLRFTFANIQLPDSNVNEPASHGLIAFRLRPVSGIAIGSTIDNAADIFFDFNEPVRTNTASLDVGITTVLEERAVNGLQLSPVPTTDRLTIHADGRVLRSVEVIGRDGRVVLRTKGASTLDVSALVPGFYLLRALAGDGLMLQGRFVKQ